MFTYSQELLTLILCYYQSKKFCRLGAMGGGSGGVTISVTNCHGELQFFLQLGDLGYGIFQKKKERKKAPAKMTLFTMVCMA